MTLEALSGKVNQCKTQSGQGCSLETPSGQYDLIETVAGAVWPGEHMPYGNCFESRWTTNRMQCQLVPLQAS